MKIVHLCLCSPFYEGYAYQDNLLPIYHKRAGHDVTIITSPYGKFKDTSGFETVPPGEYLLDDGIKLIRLRAVLPQKINTHVYWYYGLHKQLKKEKPDLMFVHGVESLNYLCLSRYKHAHPSVKIVFDNHTDKINSLHHWTTKLYSKIVVKGIIVKRLIPIAEWFYGTTPVRSTFLLEQYSVPEQKIKLLPMGADDDEMHLDKKQAIREEVRTQYDITENDFLVVTGGKIDPLKNIHVLAEAVSMIEDKNVKILIFGSIRDDLKETFDRLQSERIICVGWQPANQVYRYFYAADLVVFPGLHSVLWEQAVASKTPCAFSKIDGFEHIDIGGNCVLMDGKDAGYYKSVIEKIHQDKSFYQEMINVAESPHSEKFLYSRIAQQVIDDAFSK